MRNDFGEILMDFLASPYSSWFVTTILILFPERNAL